MSIINIKLLKFYNVHLIKMSVILHRCTCNMLINYILCIIHIIYTIWLQHKIINLLKCIFFTLKIILTNAAIFIVLKEINHDINQL